VTQNGQWNIARGDVISLSHYQEGRQFNHIQGDMTRLNKDFHSKLQPTGFTTYRIKAGIAYQTSTYQDYLNLQSSLKENKDRFNLNKHKDFKA
jgi:hypothetical protein